MDALLEPVLPRRHEQGEAAQLVRHARSGAKTEGTRDTTGETNISRRFETVTYSFVMFQTLGEDLPL